MAAVLGGAVVLALAAAALGGELTGALGGDGDRSGTLDLEPDTDAPPPTGLGRFDPGPDPVLEDGSGSWSPVRGAPSIDDPAMVWTGRELLVVGDGAATGTAVVGYALDVDAGEWRALADPPLEPGGQRTALWTGRHAVVLERGAPEGPFTPVLYEPADDTWRVGEPAPEGPWSPDIAVWDGAQVVALSEGPGEHEGAPEPGEVARYDPERDSWELGAGPDLAGHRVLDTTVLHGGVVAVVGDADAGGAAVALTHHEPSADRWSPLVPVPDRQRWHPAVVADPGRNRVVIAGPAEPEDDPGDGDGGPRLRALTWSPEEGWDDLPGSEHAPSRAPPLLATADHSVYAWWPDAGEGARHRVGATRGWQSMRPEAPLDGRDGAATFAGRRLVVLADQGAGALWDPLSDDGERADADRDERPVLEGRWREEPVDPAARERPSLAAVDGDVHVVGGLTRAGPPLDHGVVLTPASQVTARIPAGPEGHGMSPLTAWTGDELLVWSAHRRDGHTGGGAYDPAAGRWRPLPRWPHPPLGNPVGAWTGEELIVAAGAGELEAAAAYDPSADTWRELAPPDGAGQPVDAAWTGRALLVVVRAPDGVALHRYDPVANRWRGGPPAPLTVRGGRPLVAWTGDELLVWGGLGTAGSAAAYDPETDAWRRLPDAPVTATSTAVGAWTGRYLIVMGMRSDRSVGAAAYEPRRDRWLTVPDADRPVQGYGPAVWTGAELMLWNPRGRPHSFTPEP